MTGTAMVAMVLVMAGTEMVQAMTGMATIALLVLATVGKAAMVMVAALAPAEIVLTLAVAPLDHANQVISMAVIGRI